MEDQILSFVTSVATSGVIATAIVLFARTWITAKVQESIRNEYAQKLETHKATLQAANSVAVERVKSELAEETAHRHAVRAKLIERRFSAIAAIYGPLRRFYKTAQELVQPLRAAGSLSDQQLFDAVYTSYTAFEAAYSENRIFLTKQLTQAIDDVRQQLVSTANVYTTIMAPDSPGKTQRWIELYEKMEGPIATAMTQLEDAMRVLMGDAE